MRIVITGGRGFIGSNLAEHLVAKGHDVVGLGRCSSGQGYARLDRENGQAIDEGQPLSALLAGAESIVHLAAKQVDDLNAPMADYLPSNIVLTEDICRNADPVTLRKIVFASSRLVYPGRVTHDVSETFSGTPDTIYGLSKRFGEQIIEYYAEKYGWTGISLRLGQVFGPDPRNRGAVARFIQQAKEQKQVTVFGQGEAVRDFIYIKDVVSAFDRAIVSEAPSGAYNIGSGCGYSIRELALAVSNVFLDGDRSVIHKMVDDEDTSRYVIDSGKAYEYFGWKPKWSNIKNALLDMY